MAHSAVEDGHFTKKQADVCYDLVRASVCSLPFRRYGTRYPPKQRPQMRGRSQKHAPVCGSVDSRILDSMKVM